MSDNQNKNTKNRATIYQVAHQANVSLATVSRVINNHPNVTEKTRKVVLDTIKALGYKPSALAQGLAKAKTTNVGIIIPEESYVYVSNMLSGMITVAKSYGFQSTLFPTKRTKADAESQIEKLITSHVDGAVIYDDSLTVEELGQLKEYDVPIVVIGHELDDVLTASVSLDFKSAMIEACDAYFARGGTHIIFLQADNQGCLMDGLRDALGAHCRSQGKSFSLIECDDSYQRLYIDMVNRFKNDPDTKGFFIAPRDSLACAVANAASDCHIAIPQQVEVLSIIGTKYSNIARPMISSLDLDMFMVGSVAMRMLTKFMADEKNGLEDKVYPLKAVYTPRGSTQDGAKKVK